jgi:predicted enzyme involved in methoxymalonyl-ACP biosynthesis
MSCRVFERELEFEATLVASYVPPPKSAVIKDLYANLGFSPIDATDGRCGRTRWQLDLAQYAPRQTHIFGTEA